MARSSVNRILTSLTEYKGKKERDFFTGAQDDHLKRLTGTFPGRIKTSHPIFLLSANANGAQACPCTRDPYGKERYRYIRKGCLNSNQNPFPLDSTYLLEDCSFPLPRDSAFLDHLEYKGNVPKEAIGGVFRGRWR